MLDLHKQLPKAKPPHEQESLQRQIAATDKANDASAHVRAGASGSGSRSPRGRLRKE